MTYVITEGCIEDGACADVCPVECIVAGPDEGEWSGSYWIDPEVCIDCGACAPECPALDGDGVIYADDELPEDQEEWVEKNEKFFTEGPGYPPEA